MFIKQIIGRIRGEKKREKVRTEVEELKKAILEDPKFRDEILRELEYRTGRRDLLKAGVLGLLGIAVGSGIERVSSANTTPNTTPSINNATLETVSDYTGKALKPCTCIVAQDGTGDYDVSPNEDASEVIQKAIDYAHKKGGGEVRIREGKYLVRKHTITVNSNIMLNLAYAKLHVMNITLGSNVIIDGCYSSKITLDGHKGQYLYVPNSAYSRITNINRTEGNENIILKGIEIDGRRFAGVKYNRIVTFFNVKNLSVIDCYIHDGNNQLFEVFGGERIYIKDSLFENAGSGICGVGIHGAKRVWVDSVDVRNVKDLGLNISNNAENVYISNTEVCNCVAGIFIEVTNKNKPVKNIFVNNCYLHDNRHDGIGIYSTAGYGLIRDVKIIGGMSTNNLRGIRSNGDRVVIALVDVRGNKLVGIEVSRLYGVKPGDHKIINCIE
jgi:hypothetical protein